MIMTKCNVRRIELLAPARNLETGVAAINHGADAVYIGAPRFGARQAAGNSVEDIGRLVEYAHVFGVKVYVTLNTIIEDSDIEAVEKLVCELYDVGVDALIVQDMALLKMDLPPIELHASTQTDNRDVAKVRFLNNVGFSRVVLARELSLQEIAHIHKEVPDAELEVFVHGALCVSYSGQCYASQHCFGRSANRGECAQFCRLAFDLVDADGKIICNNKHLLSLKDMNRSDYVEEMLDAGVTSLKIEGRLKDISYVKNITAYYRAKLDAIMQRRSEYVRSSLGQASPQFVATPEKSFNRGFTDYLLVGDKEGITSFDTPKSIGERMGIARVVARSFFTMQGGKEYRNGDGACFVGRDGKLYGFRINKVERGRIFPQSMPPLYQGAELFRNYDIEFEKLLANSDMQRRLSLQLTFAETEDGFSLSALAEDGCGASVCTVFAKSEARNPQYENIDNQLRKWGNTHFEITAVEIKLSKEWFVPSSMLSDMRRRLNIALVETRRAGYKRAERKSVVGEICKYPQSELDYRGNVANSLARQFYVEHGVESITSAYEVQIVENAEIMSCKHCIKYSMGWCKRSGAQVPYKEPLYLVSGDGRRFRLHFDCRECLMKVMAEG